MVSTPLKFPRKYFRISLARSAYYLREVLILYSWKNFHDAPENCESLAQQIFPLQVMVAIWFLYVHKSVATVGVMIIAYIG